MVALFCRHFDHYSGYVKTKNEEVLVGEALNLKFLRMSQPLHVLILSRKSSLSWPPGPRFKIEVQRRSRIRFLFVMHYEYVFSLVNRGCTRKKACIHIRFGTALFPKKQSSSGALEEQHLQKSDAVTGRGTCSTVSKIEHPLGISDCQAELPRLN